MLSSPSEAGACVAMAIRARRTSSFTSMEAAGGGLLLLSLLQSSEQLWPSASLCPLLKRESGGGGSSTFSGGPSMGGERRWEEEADFLHCKCVGWESRRESGKFFLVVVLLRHLCCVVFFCLLPSDPSVSASFCHTQTNTHTDSSPSSTSPLWEVQLPAVGLIFLYIPVLCCVVVVCSDTQSCSAPRWLPLARLPSFMSLIGPTGLFIVCSVMKPSESCLG